MANAVGKLNLVSSNYDAAVEAFDYALELNPELLDSLVSKAMALYFNPEVKRNIANLWADQVGNAEWPKPRQISRVVIAKGKSRRRVARVLPIDRRLEALKIPVIPVRYR